MKRSGLGPRFLLPASLCEVGPTKLAMHGPAHRTFLTILWITHAAMRSDQPVRFRIQLSDLRLAAGLHAYHDNRCLTDQLAIIEGTDYPEPMGSSRCFDSFEISDNGRGPCLVCTPSAALATQMVRPERYAMINIREISQLKKSLDIIFYLRLRLAWKMTNRKVVIPSDLIRNLTGSEAAGWKHLRPQVSGALARVETALGTRISAEQISEPGGKAVSEIHLLPAARPLKP